MSNRNETTRKILYVLLTVVMVASLTVAALIVGVDLVQRFLSQPMFVAEKFTGVPGAYVPIRETLRGFKAIVSGETDDLPEAAFFNVGTLDDVYAKAKRLKEGAV